MLLTIDPEFCKDFESLGPYELMMAVEERFRKPVEQEQSRIYKMITECKLKEGSSVDSHEKSVDILLESLTSEYDLFVQMYRKENRKRVFMEMRPLLNFYESLLDRHSSRNSATSELSLEKGHCQKRARLSGYVFSWEPLKSDTVKERLEDAPKSETDESSVHYRVKASGSVAVIYWHSKLDSGHCLAGNTGWDMMLKDFMVKESRWYSDGRRVIHRLITTPRNSLRVQSRGLKPQNHRKSQYTLPEWS
ncbi:hypothetical protein L1887_11805 [Cichorium endivia]|nr:hypothetical protein L1887_11805 [Cichorium endivia]